MLLNQTEARRLERADSRRREENAVAWWRGVREARLVGDHMMGIFESDVGGLTGLRYLVLIGEDEKILGRWSNTTTPSGERYISI